jgi:hypothetical protein
MNKSMTEERVYFGFFELIDTFYKNTLSSVKELMRERKWDLFEIKTSNTPILCSYNSCLKQAKYEIRIWISGITLFYSFSFCEKHYNLLENY